MKIVKKISIAYLNISGALLIFLTSTSVSAETFRDNIAGNVSLELTSYFQDALYPQQTDEDISVSAEIEYKKKFNNDDTVFTFTPFYRIDKNKTREHGDIRQFDIVHYKDDWEFQAGLGKVFWGVTESQHLVDIINQTDTLEGFDGEDKLGQPMLRATRVLDDGAFDFFILPYFRERKFADAESRLRAPLLVDESATTYESSKKEKRIDIALRYTKTIDEFDVGLSYFQGTSRDPVLTPNSTVNPTALNPHYPLIKQVGLDFQYTGEATIWKLESIYRDTQPENYSAFTVGFEHTLPAINEAGADLGLLAEYHHDSRGNNSAVILQNDLFVGARLALNDEAGSELLAGILVDVDNQSQSLRIEGSRRLNDGLKVNLEAQWFTNNEPSFSLRNDDFIKLEVQKYF